MPGVSNREFLEAIFGTEWPNAHVTSVVGDPGDGSVGWKGAKAGQRLEVMPDTTNNYYAVSLTEQGRRHNAWRALYVIVVDDVGTKVEALDVECTLGIPTYVIETSPGSEHWGFVLDQPVTDFAEAKALCQAVDAKLPGADTFKNMVRYVRLPVGFNGKPGVMRPTRLKFWRSSARTPVGQLAQDLGLNLVPGQTGPTKPTKTTRINSGVNSGGDTDAILEAFAILDLIIDGPRAGTSLGANTYDVRCPWEGDHTGAPTGTAYAPWGGFKCHHGHCAHRTMTDLRERLDELLIAAGHASGLSGLAGADFDDVDPAKLPKASKPVLASKPVAMFVRGARKLQAPTPRVWVAEDVLTRGAVTMVFGPPNQGKSLLLTGWAAALGLGLSLGKFKPHKACKVLTVFAEEDEDDQLRRFIAASLALGSSPDKLEDNLDRLVCRELATLLKVDPRTGEVTETAGWRELVAEIRAFCPDVVFLDPLVEIHTAEENDNTKLKAVIGKLRSLAARCNLAVVLAHHTGKGEFVPGTLDKARGASAIGGAVRMAFSVVEMSEVEAEKFGVAQDRRRYFIRVDEARNAYAPPASAADWFEKVPYQLPGTGERAPALMPWQPPVSTAPAATVIGQLMQAIGQGCPAAGGMPWSPQLSDKPRSIRQLLRQHGVSKLDEAATLKALADEGVVLAMFKHPTNRWPAQGMRTDAGMPNAAWSS